MSQKLIHSIHSYKYTNADYAEYAGYADYAKHGRYPNQGHLLPLARGESNSYSRHKGLSA